MTEEKARKGLSRRSFVKFGVLGGVAALGAYTAYRYPLGWDKWVAYGRKSWEVDAGVVDYNVVKEDSWGPTELGFQNEIRSSPPEQRILNVAQWYDYWPGNVVEGFGTWMREKWNVSGVEIRWNSNIYTSNEELFTWITQTGRKFDVMFPTNYTVETMEKAGLVVNLNRDWIPSFIYMFGPVPNPLPPSHPEYRYEPDYPVFPNGYNNQAGVDFRTPANNGYMYRMNAATYPNPRGTDVFTWDEQNSLIAVPYQWGTTGIGYRTDVFDRADIERLGWEIFEFPTYRNPTSGVVHDLTRRKMLLDDMREVFTAALKRVGWKRQEEFKAQGLTTADPTAIPKNLGPTLPPGSTPATYAESPFNGDFQWSSNETAEEKLQSALDWLNSFRGGSWGFNTPQQGPWLVSGERYVDQAWSGDIMYAVQPNSSSFAPVDYFVPKQGGARWIDNSVIHRESEKLWLSHELINYIHDPKIQAAISSWNLYATPNAWTFELLHHDPAYSFEGQYPDGSPYSWNPAADHRIYSDIAYGTYGVEGATPPAILNRCEYQKDVGVRNTLTYFKYWRQAKF